MAWTLRRLMAGRLIGMAVEGFGTWILLMLGGVPMATLLGVLTGRLAFLPNIGAIISGVLIVLVGFSAGVNTGLYAVDRKRVWYGKSVSVRVGIGGRRIIK